MARVSLKSRFPEIIGKMPRQISKNLKEGAERIEETASANLNNRTGTLDASGEVTGGSGEFRVKFGAGEAYYAEWIEYGRKNAPPYPFLVPAAESEMPNIVSDISDTLNSL